MAEPRDFEGLELYPMPSTKHEVYGAIFSFFAALVALASAMLHFWSSNIRYRNFLMVRQGGLVTYGPSEPQRWAIDPDNQNAGAVFAVGHWYVAQSVKVGYVALFEIILAVYAVMVLGLLYAWYTFSTLRENQLDNGWTRWPVQGFRAGMQSTFGLLVARVPGAHRVLASYRSTYVRIARELAAHYDIAEFAPAVTFTKPWDGTLAPPLRLQQHRVRDVMRGPTEDQIEKAAAFLAGDRYGRLRYAQTIALLSSERLINAADGYRKTGKIPCVGDIVQFCRLYYIKGVLIPEWSSSGLRRKDFRIFGVDIAGDHEALVKHPKSAVLLVLPENSDDLPPGMQLFAVIGDVGPEWAHWQHSATNLGVSSSIRGLWRVQ